VRRGFSVQAQAPLEYWADSTGQAGRRQRGKCLRQEASSGL